MANIYSSIDTNKRKSALIIGLFGIFVAISAYLIYQGLSYFYGFPGYGYGFVFIPVLFSSALTYFSYYYSDRIILSISHAHPADPNRDHNFFSAAQNLSLAASITVPDLYIIEDTAMNAFAAGRDPSHSIVCVTSGLLQTLSKTELEGVIGHEISHIRNFDTRLMSVTAVLIGILTLLGDWMVRSSFYSRSDDRENKNGAAIFILIGIIFALLSPLIAQLIQLAISRRREFFADASSAKLTRQPSGLISALQKLSKDTEPLEAANKATAHLYIINPLKNQHNAIRWFSGLFNTHPPISQRIEALNSMM